MISRETCRYIGSKKLKPEEFKLVKDLKVGKVVYRYMYLKKAWYLKTYIDANSSTDFEKLHQIKN